MNPNPVAKPKDAEQVQIINNFKGEMYENRVTILSESN